MKTIFSKFLLAAVAGSLCFATFANAQSWQRQQDFNRQRQIDQQRQDAAREQLRRAEQQRIRDEVRQQQIRQEQARVRDDIRNSIKQDRANDARQQVLTTAKQQREDWRQQGKLGVARPAGDAAGRAGPFRASNGIAAAPRQPTPAEAKRGYTGKVTADGKALVRFQNRVVAVPSSRIGVAPRRTETSQTALATGWSQQKQASISAEFRKLAAGGGSGAGKSAVTQTSIAAAVQGRIADARQKRLLSNENKYSSRFSGAASQPTWADLRTLDDHFKRHGAQVGARDKYDYMRIAAEFFADRKKYHCKIDSNGGIRVYDEHSGRFGSFTNDGLAKTFFSIGRNRSGNDSYWAKQLGGAC